MVFIRRLALERDLRCTDDNTRLRAIYAVADLGTGAAPLVAELVQLLDDTNHYVDHRMVIVRALHRLGPIARAAGPQLAVKMRTDPSVSWRVYYASAYWRVTGGGDRTLPIWREALDHGDDGLWALVGATNLIGDQAAPAWPLFETRVATGAEPAILLNLTHIAQTLLGRAEASRVLASRLGHQRTLQLFDELAARAASD